MPRAGGGRGGRTHCPRGPGQLQQPGQRHGIGDERKTGHSAQGRASLGPDEGLDVAGKGNGSRCPMASSLGDGENGSAVQSNHKTRTSRGKKHLCEATNSAL